MARQVGAVERDGILALDDGNLAARRFTRAFGQSDVACRVDAGAALAGRADHGILDDDRALAAVRGEGAAVSAFRRDVDMVGFNRAIVRRIESARRIVLRVDRQVAGLDVALGARGEDGIGPVGVRGQHEVLEYGRAVRSEQDGVLPAEIAGIGARRIADLVQRAIGECQLAAVAHENGILIRLSGGDVLLTKALHLVVDDLSG